MSPKPNVLFLLSDQQRADTLGCVNPAIHTPHLDALAAGGLFCERAYPPTPVCLPCRASLMSGLYPSSHRACYNDGQLDPAIIPTMGSIFRHAGYHTHFIGKSHLSSCLDPSSPEAPPHIHNRPFFRNWHGPYYGFQYADLSIGHSTERHACGMHYGVWLEDQGIDTTAFFGKTDYFDWGSWDLPEQYHSSKWVADTTIQSILEAQERGQPFMIWGNFQDPHNPYFVPEPWASMYNPAEMPLYGFKAGEPESFATKPPFYNELLTQPGDYNTVYSDAGMPKATNSNRHETTERERREIAAHYYGMVSLMDHHIGRIVEVLRHSGLLENTIIVFTSDHGDFLGDHGLWYKGVAAFEEAQRVPMIVHYPEKVPQGRSTPAFQNLVDIPPTLASLAGLRIPREWEGFDQSVSWQFPSRISRSFNIIEERPFDTDFNQRVIHEGEYKLCYYSGRDYGELYHLGQDPHQIENLWKREDYSNVRYRLINRILDHEMNKRSPAVSPSERDRHPF